LELGRFRRHSGENDHRNIRRYFTDDVAPRTSAQAQVDDRGREMMLRERVETIVRRLGRHRREAVKFEKLHERPTDGRVVFDNQHEARASSGHVWRLSRTAARLYVRERST